MQNIIMRRYETQKLINEIIKESSIPKKEKINININIEEEIECLEVGDVVMHKYSMQQCIVQSIGKKIGVTLPSGKRTFYERKNVKHCNVKI